MHQQQSNKSAISSGSADHPTSSQAQLPAQSAVSAAQLLQQQQNLLQQNTMSSVFSQQQAQQQPAGQSNLAATIELYQQIIAQQLQQQTAQQLESSQSQQSQQQQQLPINALPLQFNSSLHLQSSTANRLNYQQQQQVSPPTSHSGLGSGASSAFVTVSSQTQPTSLTQTQMPVSSTALVAALSHLLPNMNPTLFQQQQQAQTSAASNPLNTLTQMLLPNQLVLQQQQQQQQQQHQQQLLSLLQAFQQQQHGAHVSSAVPAYQNPLQQSLNSQPPQPRQLPLHYQPVAAAQQQHQSHQNLLTQFLMANSISSATAAGVSNPQQQQQFGPHDPQQLELLLANATTQNSQNQLVQIPQKVGELSAATASTTEENKDLLEQLLLQRLREDQQLQQQQHSGLQRESNSSSLNTLALVAASSSVLQNSVGNSKETVAGNINQRPTTSLNSIGEQLNHSHSLGIIGSSLSAVSLNYTGNGSVIGNTDSHNASTSQPLPHTRAQSLVFSPSLGTEKETLAINILREHALASSASTQENNGNNNGHQLASDPNTASAPSNFQQQQQQIPSNQQHFSVNSGVKSLFAITTDGQSTASQSQPINIGSSMTSAVTALQSKIGALTSASRQQSSDRLLTNAESVQDHISRLISENEAIIEPNPVLLKRRPYHRQSTSNSITSQTSECTPGGSRDSPIVQQQLQQLQQLQRNPTTRSHSLHEASLLNSLRLGGSLTSGQPIFRSQQQQSQQQMQLTSEGYTCNFCQLKFPNEAGLKAHEFRCSKKETLMKQYSQPQLKNLPSSLDQQQQLAVVTTQQQLLLHLQQQQQQRLLAQQQQHQSNIAALVGGGMGVAPDVIVNGAGDCGRSSVPIGAGSGSNSEVPGQTTNVSESTSCGNVTVRNIVAALDNVSVSTSSSIAFTTSAAAASTCGTPISAVPTPPTQTTRAYGRTDSPVLAYQSSSSSLPSLASTAAAGGAKKRVLESMDSDSRNVVVDVVSTDQPESATKIAKIDNNDLNFVQQLHQQRLQEQELFDRQVNQYVTTTASTSLQQQVSENTANFSQQQHPGNININLALLQQFTQQQCENSQGVVKLPAMVSTDNNVNITMQRQIQQQQIQQSLKEQQILIEKLGTKQQHLEEQETETAEQKLLKQQTNLLLQQNRLELQQEQQQASCSNLMTNSDIKSSQIHGETLELLKLLQQHRLNAQQLTESQLQQLAAAVAGSSSTDEQASAVIANTSLNVTVTTTINHQQQSKLQQPVTIQSSSLISPNEVSLTQRTMESDIQSSISHTTNDVSSGKIENNQRDSKHLLSQPTKDAICCAIAFVGRRLRGTCVDNMPYMVTLIPESDGVTTEEEGGSNIVGKRGAIYRQRVRNITTDTFVCLHYLRPTAELGKASVYSHCWQSALTNTEEKVLLSLFLRACSATPKAVSRDSCLYAIASTGAWRTTHSSFWELQNKMRNSINNVSTQPEDTQSVQTSIAPVTINNETPTSLIRHESDVYITEDKKAITASVLTTSSNNNVAESINAHVPTTSIEKKSIIKSTAVLLPKVKPIDGTEEVEAYVRGRGRGRYVCERCGIRCKKPSMLKKHLKSHTNIRPFTCITCNFAFKTKGNFTKHLFSKAHRRRLADDKGYDESISHHHAFRAPAEEQEQLAENASTQFASTTNDINSTSNATMTVNSVATTSTTLMDAATTTMNSDKIDTRLTSKCMELSDDPRIMKLSMLESRFVNDEFEHNIDEDDENDDDDDDEDEDGFDVPNGPTDNQPPPVSSAISSYRRFGQENIIVERSTHTPPTLWMLCQEDLTSFWPKPDLERGCNSAPPVALCSPHSTARRLRQQNAHRTRRGLKGYVSATLPIKTDDDVSATTTADLVAASVSVTEEFVGCVSSESVPTIIDIKTSQATPLFSSGFNMDSPYLLADKMNLNENFNGNRKKSSEASIGATQLQNQLIANFIPLARYAQISGTNSLDTYNVGTPSTSIITTLSSNNIDDTLNKAQNSFFDNSNILKSCEINTPSTSQYSLPLSVLTAAGLLTPQQIQTFDQQKLSQSIGASLSQPIITTPKQIVDIKQQQQLLNNSVNVDANIQAHQYLGFPVINTQPGPSKLNSKAKTSQVVATQQTQNLQLSTKLPATSIQITGNEQAAGNSSTRDIQQQLHLQQELLNALQKSQQQTAVNVDQQQQQHQQKLNQDQGFSQQHEQLLLSTQQGFSLTTNAVTNAVLPQYLQLQHQLSPKQLIQQIKQQQEWQCQQQQQPMNQFQQQLSLLQQKQQPDINLMEAFLAKELQNLQCDMCEKNFHKESDLVLHRQTHLIERQQHAKMRSYQCVECRTTFKSKTLLGKHMESAHRLDPNVVLHLEDDDRSNHSTTGMLNGNGTSVMTVDSTASTPTSPIITSATGLSSSASPIITVGNHYRNFVCTDCNLAFRTHGVLSKHLRSKNHVKSLVNIGRLPEDALTLVKDQSHVLSGIDASDCEMARNSLLKAIAKLRAESNAETNFAEIATNGAALVKLQNFVVNGDTNGSIVTSASTSIGISESAATSGSIINGNGQIYNNNNITSSYQKPVGIQLAFGLKRKTEDSMQNEGIFSMNQAAWLSNEKTITVNGTKTVAENAETFKPLMKRSRFDETEQSVDNAAKSSDSHPTNTATDTANTSHDLAQSSQFLKL